MNTETVSKKVTAPHRCAGCGQVGRLPTADPAPDDQRPVLRLAFTSAGVRLLWALCRDAQA